jgi:hypothetical protein
VLLICGVEHNGWFQEVPSCELPKYLCTFWSCKFQKKKKDNVEAAWVEYMRTEHPATPRGNPTAWLF